MDRCVLPIGILLLASMLRFSLQQQCLSTNDVGGVECVLLTPYYTQYQWATCLTNDYIRRSSDQQHHCLRDATICWYQCMVELYDVELATGGPVYDGCRCSPGEMRTEAPTDNLPPHCYSPRGEDCRWYRDCLEVRYPCEGTSDGYAIEYAEKFCNLYANNYNDFSTVGRAWVDGVRKCLQVVLVPSLRPWVSKTCKDIRMEAFASHSNCYINPASGVPGICELPCFDIWRSFWLVNFEGRAFSSAPIETGKQMLSVIGRCFVSGPLSVCNPAIQTAILLTVPIPRIGLHLAAAIGVTTYIAETLDWESNGFRWFPFIDDDDNSDLGNRKKRQIITEYTSVKVLLVDAKALNISNGTMLPQSQGQNLDEVIEDLANAVGSGLFSEVPLVLNSTKMILSVNSVGQCTELDVLMCNSTNTIELATAPPPPGSSTALLTQLHYMAVIFVMGIHMFT